MSEDVSLKELIDKLCTQNNWGACTNNTDYYATFEEVAEVVWISAPRHHRWYTMYDVVRKLVVDGVEYFFKDKSMSVDGDNSPEDCGWQDPKIEEIVQVFPKQVMTTAYVTADNL